MTGLLQKIRHLGRRGVLKLCLWTGGCLLVAGVSLWWIIPWCWPLPEGLVHYSPPGAVIMDRNGEPIAHLPGRDYYRGGPVAYADLSEDFIKATLAAEDKRFFSHGGLDLVALARAMKSNISAGRIVSGASTISQQLVKISSPRGQRNVWVKFREFFQARHMEMSYEKTKILEEYFSRLDYGNLREGAVSAAQFYFGKEIDNLSLAECALLAAIPQSPSRLNPLKHPERTLKRRNWILERMETEFGYSSASIERAKKEPLHFARETTDSVVAPHLMSRLMAKGVRGEVATTLDGALQKEAQRIVLEELKRLDGRNVSQIAALVVDNKTGEILAWVGSANRSDPSGGLMDGVLTPRSAGSTLKPFVYALAFQRGAWAGFVFPDIPTVYRSPDGGEAPRNYNNRYRGPLTVRDALACSQNIPAMRALQFAGGAGNFVDYLRKLGFENLRGEHSMYGLGLAIGNAEIRLVDLVRAYSMMARGGKSVPLSLGAELPGFGTEKESQLMPAEVAFVLSDILSDRLARVDAFGMNTPLNLPFKCAVKTGTSSDFRDNWCVGFTREYTVGIWMGNFDFRRMENVSGVSGSGPVFAALMKELHKDVPASMPEAPEEVEEVEIDIRSGHLVQEGVTIPREFRRKEWAFTYRKPETAFPSEYDDKGRYKLGSIYQEWYESDYNARMDAYALDPLMWTGEELPRIISPAPKATLILDPEIPGQGRIVPLKSNMPAGVIWSCDTLSIFNQEGRYMAELVPGKHVIRAEHPELELDCEAEITVRNL